MKILDKLQIIVFTVMAIIVLLHFFAGQFVAGAAVLVALVMQLVVTVLYGLHYTK
jgi:hypothetical protein